MCRIKSFQIWWSCFVCTIKSFLYGENLLYYTITEFLYRTELIGLKTDHSHLKFVNELKVCSVIIQEIFHHVLKFPTGSYFLDRSLNFPIKQNWSVWRESWTNYSHLNFLSEITSSSKKNIKEILNHLL